MSSWFPIKSYMYSYPFIRPSIRPFIIYMEYIIAMLKISVGGALIFSDTAIVDVFSPGGPVQVFFDFIIAINGVNLESLS